MTELVKPCSVPPRLPAFVEAMEAKLVGRFQTQA
jgi:hypothetical protein